MRVLITNIEMSARTGTTMFVRDLALELRRQGHTPAVYTFLEGDTSADLQRAGIPVYRDLGRLGFSPDVIHGHHYGPTLEALHRFPATPAIHICHDHVSWADRTPRHPNIRRHFGVSALCVERLVAEGVSRHRTSLFFNFVDLNRFRPRGPLPARPHRALLFSNYAHRTTHAPAVRRACELYGLQLDVMGARVGTAVARPETVLPTYDVVFAKAKAAIEAMAVGTAVVLCDVAGVGPMVTAAEFGSLRRLNFGFQALREPLQVDQIVRQICRYDSLDAARVRDQLRSTAAVDQAVTYLSRVYTRIRESHRHSPSRVDHQHTRWSLRRERFAFYLSKLMQCASPGVRRVLTRAPLLRTVFARTKERLLSPPSEPVV